MAALNVASLSARTDGETRPSGASTAALNPRLRAWHALALGVALCLAAAAAAPASAPDTRPVQVGEYDLKAVFLLYFPRFMEWPEGAFPSVDSPITIGILGDDPFGATLDEIVVDEIVEGRKLVVARYRRVEDIDACHVLFVSRSESERVFRILAALKGRHVLTVGETSEFTAAGGIIRFVVDQGKIRLQINAEVARSEGLTISSKLLRQAEIVGGEGAP